MRKHPVITYLIVAGMYGAISFLFYIDRQMVADTMWIVFGLLGVFKLLKITVYLIRKAKRNHEQNTHKTPPEY